IRGRVFDGRTGQSPRSAQIMLLPRTGSYGVSGFFFGLNSYNGSTGTFEMRDISPGSYWLSVQSTAPATSVDGAPTRNAAQLSLEVTNADLDNIVVAFSPGITIPGRISVEGGTSFSSLKDYDRVRPFLSAVVD